jgi:hypothetical protein
MLPDFHHADSAIVDFVAIVVDLAVGYDLVLPSPPCNLCYDSLRHRCRLLRGCFLRRSLASPLHLFGAASFAATTDYSYFDMAGFTSCANNFVISAIVVFATMVEYFVVAGYNFGPTAP